MKEYTSDKIRNVAVLSHDGAGKTAVVESLLLACGAVDAVGVGKDNKHIMDYEPEEIKRNVTIQLGIAPCEWEGYKLNFLDTPGYSEFCGEVRAALRASDGILLVVSAESGVEMDTERAWDYGVELKLPRMVYVNKMDAEHADFFGCLEKLRAVFGKSIMPLQIPIGEGKDFRGIIDVCKMVAWEWNNGECSEIKVPPEYMAKAREVREMCMEAAAEGDDELLEKYLNGDELTIEELRKGLRQGMLTGRVCPLMCGSAINHIGTAELLRRIITYMPDASQKVMMGTDKKTGEPVLVYPNKPFTAFVFKTLVARGASKQYYVFDVPVAENLDLKKAAKAVGEKSIEMIHQKELLPLTGYVHGGCSPVGMKKLFPTVFHSSAENLAAMIVSAGKIGYQVELAPHDLAALVRAKFADIIVE